MSDDPSNTPAGAPLPPLDRFVFGDLVRQARIANGMTQRDIGLGSRAHMQDVENGRKWPGFEFLGYLRRRLGLDVNAILDRLPEAKRELVMPERGDIITVGDRSMTISQWSEHTGVSISTILVRINKLGWPVARAVTLPDQRGKARGPRKWKAAATDLAPPPVR